MRVCSRCHLEPSVGGTQYYCRNCANRISREHQPPTDRPCTLCGGPRTPGPSGKVYPQCAPCKKEKSHESKLKTRYGLTVGQYNAMLRAQAGGCAICGASKGRLAVDHNHHTGEVRGLLCNPCNAALGAFKDSPKLLRRAAAYLA